MSVPVVRLKIRVRLSDGSRQFLDPVSSANGKLKPLHAVVNDKPEHHPEGVYYLRYLKDGKRVWESVGSDPQLALTRKLQQEKYFEATAVGIPVPAVGIPVVDDSEESSGTQRLLTDAIAQYLAETKEHKSKKTFAAYKGTLDLYLEATARKHLRKVTGADIQGDLTPESIHEAVKEESLENIAREDLLEYICFLRKRESAPRTVRNRVDSFQIFLHHFGLPSLLKGKDLPKFTEKTVRAYNERELDLMLSHATQDESDLLNFLLCTGTREQEVQYACWSDVDLHRKTYTVTEHLDLGYKPKDSEEGTIPIPESLIEILKKRRAHYPKTRLIFPGTNGKTNGHLLRIIKSLALKAGVNCGHCVNKAGKSCDTHPVCKHIVLHKMRKTYASRLHKKNLPPRTLMRYLRHSDLETTLRYIADEDDDQTRGIINSAFSELGGVQ
jgi:integrase/recombinase XerD